jgi:hypothetical protein
MPAPLAPAPLGPVVDGGAIVTVTPPTDLSDQDVRDLLRGLEDRLSIAVPYVLLFDLSHAAMPSPLQRQLLTAHMKRNRELIHRRIRALGVVAPSSLIRGVLTALFWIEAPPVPHQIFATNAGAAAWAQARMTPR